jgi:hypothetical protein
LRLKELLLRMFRRGQHERKLYILEVRGLEDEAKGREDKARKGEDEARERVDEARE